MSGADDRFKLGRDTVWGQGPGPRDGNGHPVRAARYGDGLFATLLATGGRLLDASEHAARLLRGAARIDLDPPPGLADPAAIVRALGKAALRAGAAASDGVIRCQWSAAGEGRGYGRARASTCVVEAFSPPPPRRLAVAVLADGEVPPPVLADVKTCSALPHVLAARAAGLRGAAEAIRVHEGAVTEGVAANLFWMSGGRLRTPDASLPLYPGIVRRRVLEAAEAIGLPCEEGRWAPGELRENADLVFLTGSVRGLERVAVLDDRTLDPDAGAAELRLLSEAVDRARRAGSFPVAAGPSGDG